METPVPGLRIMFAPCSPLSRYSSPELRTSEKIGDNRRVTCYSASSWVSPFLMASGSIR
jgi:hypothetical protein